MLIKRSAWVGEEEISGFGKPASRILGADTETTGNDPWGTLGLDRKVAPSRPFFFSFCDNDGQFSWVRCPVNAKTREVFISRKAKDALETYLADARLAKVFHNAPFDRRMLGASSIRMAGKIHCSMIGMHAVRPNEVSFKLKPLCKKYLGIGDEDEKDLKDSVVRARRLAKKRGWTIAEEVAADYWLGDPELCKLYGLEDSRRCLALRLAQEEHFEQEPGLVDVYERELRLMDDIAEMEDRGTRLDEERLGELRSFYQKIVDEHAKVVKKEAAGVNLNSPKQMTKFWFDLRGHTPLRYSVNKKKGGSPTPCQHCKGKGCKVCQETGQNPKCDGEFLEHVGVKRVQDAKGEEKLVPGDRLAWAMLHHQAADSMLRFVTQYEELACREDGQLILHPNYKQVGARTARISCERPNLMNVASDESGKKRVDVPYRTREVFIPRPECTYYIPDYSQIEIWVLALLSGDEDFIGALAKGGDAHQNVADLIWGHTYDKARAKKHAKIDPDELAAADLANLKHYKHGRKRAKNLQFCKVYGGGAAKIAGMIGCSVHEAKKFMKDYNERLPSVQEYMDRCIGEAKLNGKVVNPFGRIYPVDRGFEYRAINYLVQGTAAEIMKNAMMRVAALLRSDEWRGKAWMLLTIHDELLIEALRKYDSNRLRRLVVEAMSADWKRLGSPVPFPIGFKTATERWSSAKDVEVDLAA